MAPAAGTLLFAVSFANQKAMEAPAEPDPEHDHLAAVPLTDAADEALHVTLTQPEKMWLALYLECTRVTRCLSKRARIGLTAAVTAATALLLVCFLTVHTSFVHVCNRDDLTSCNGQSCDLMTAILADTPNHVSLLHPYIIDNTTNATIPVSIGIQISHGSELALQYRKVPATQAQATISAQDYAVSVEVHTFSPPVCCPSLLDAASGVQ